MLKPPHPQVCSTRLCGHHRRRVWLVALLAAASIPASAGPAWAVPSVADIAGAGLADATAAADLGAVAAGAADPSAAMSDVEAVAGSAPDALGAAAAVAGGGTPDLAADPAPVESPAPVEGPPPVAAPVEPQRVGVAPAAGAGPEVEAARAPPASPPTDGREPAVGDDVTEPTAPAKAGGPALADVAALTSAAPADLAALVTRATQVPPPLAAQPPAAGLGAAWPAFEPGTAWTAFDFAPFDFAATLGPATDTLRFDAALEEAFAFAFDPAALEPARVHACRGSGLACLVGRLGADPATWLPVLADRPPVPVPSVSAGAGGLAAAPDAAMRAASADLRPSGSAPAPTAARFSFGSPQSMFGDLGAALDQVSPGVSGAPPARAHEGTGAELPAGGTPAGAVASSGSASSTGAPSGSSLAWLLLISISIPSLLTMLRLPVAPRRPLLLVPRLDRPG